MAFFVSQKFDSETIHLISSPCEPSREGTDVSDEDPGDGAGDGSFEVFGKPTASTEPGEGSLHHPSTRQHFEAGCLIGAFDDGDRPGADLAQGVAKLVPGIAAVGEDVAQPGIQGTDR